MKMNYSVALVFTLFLAGLPAGNRAAMLRMSASAQRGEGEVLLKKGAEVTLILEEPVSSTMPQSGGVIGLGVYLDVKVDDYVVINAGRYAAGKASARRSGFFGRPGKVSLQALNVQTVDGQTIPLESLPLAATGSDRYALAIVGSIVLPAVGVILGPANPWAWWLTAGIGFGFLVKGKEVEIPVHTKFRAFVKRDVWIKVSNN
ncbi:MAG: hypothetical protein EPGJADBJ_03390 [Saprospiraceae bacterium]|nr:hypothetical protein [Saprospiraceae bacterium]